MEVVIGLGGGLFLLLVFLHIILLFVNINRLAVHKRLEKQWAEILPFKENVDSVINEMRILQMNCKSIDEMAASGEIPWSHKLNILSDSLPRDVWIRKISLSQEMLFIEGSAISKQREDMINVHKLTANLKKQKDFLSDFADFELGSIQRRRIKKVEIADFLITTKLE